MFNNTTDGAPIPRGIPPKSVQCTYPTLTEFYFHTAFLIFILLLTFIGNFMVVLAVVMFHRMRTITNYFVVSLALSDLLVSLLSLPFRLDQTVHNTAWCLSLEACITWIVFDIICSGASIWNLAMISIDRFIAIVMPFRYHTLMTQRTGFSLMATAWSVSFVSAMLSLVNFTEPGKPHFNTVTQCAKHDKIYWTVVSVTGFFLPLSIVLVMYGKVFTVALNQARAVAALQTDNRHRGRRSSINLVKEVKAAKILAIVIGCFVICWFPFFVLTLLSLWNLPLLQKIPREVNRSITLVFVYVLPALNSTMNPIIYALFNKDFRQAFRKIFVRISGRALGAVGMDETSMSVTNDVRAPFGPKSKGSKLTRFKDPESESELPPTIPIRDPNAFYNEGFESQNSEQRLNTSSELSNGCPRGDQNTVSTGLPSVNKSFDNSDDIDLTNFKRKKLVRLPPLQRSRTSTDASDDVDDIDTNRMSGHAGDFRTQVLPPIECRPERKVLDVDSCLHQERNQAPGILTSKTGSFPNSDVDENSV